VAICSGIDAHGFDWQIWAVSSSGFFTDSYNLFATNVILPMLAFVYWRADPLEYSANHENAINLVTLGGSFIGMLLFGFLADKLGRKKLYGVELVIVIFGTLGVVQCGAGYNQQSMDVLGWMLFWRFLVGVGIGINAWPVT
jgi:MFS transporter, PHS family, inorganic phosphate transporter